MDSTFDLKIVNGRVATASDVFDADIGVRDGVIDAIGRDLGNAVETIDATGRCVVPGGIDSHVHLAQDGPPGVVMGDNFETGTRAALFGGTTTVMPFCLQKKGQTLREALQDYEGRTRDACHCDVSLHLIIADPTPQVLGQELPALIAEGYSSVKVFMTYEGLALADYEILGVMRAAREHGAIVMIHAENFDVIRFRTEELEASGKLAPLYHSESRPIAVEREATHRAIALAELSDVPTMIVHVSNNQAIEEITRGRSRGVRVFSETCPQYLTLTEADMGGVDLEGAKYVCSPPPRDAESQAACWRALSDGVFDVLSSDHCPFRYDETGKLTPDARKGFRWIPNGIPGVETRLPILFSEGVVKGRIDLPRFVALSATNHAKIYGLYPRKGTIAIGTDADVVLWDPERVQTISRSILHHGVDYTPFEGMKITGWPETVILRGRVVVRDGVLLADGRTGQLLARPPSVDAVAREGARL